MKGIVRFLIRMFVLNLVLVPIMVLGPLLYMIPLFCIAANPQGNFSGLAQLYFWLGPLSCAFWMLVSCHWPTVHRARLEGRLSTWRETEGGIVRTVAKSTFYMFGGLFASYVSEVLFLLAFSYVPYSVASGVARETLGFAIFPFATYAPVILLWLSRWMRGRKQGDFISRAKNDRELRDKLRAASLYAKNLRIDNLSNLDIHWHRGNSVSSDDSADRKPTVPTNCLEQPGKLLWRDCAFPVATQFRGEPTQKDSGGNIQKRAARFGWTLLIAASIVHAQDTPPATAVGPWRTGVAVTCSDGRTIPANTVISGPNATVAELCGSNSSGGTSGTSPASAAKISNTGNFKQDLVTNGTNLFIASHTTNPIVSNFMQSAATSFISSMFANNAEAQRQQALMSQEILRRQQEQEQQRRIAEQQRLDAMFARLSRELKLEGLPFSLSLKGMNSSDPNGLPLKGMSSSGPGDLKLKISDANSTEYGIKGLPGIYVGGPAGGDGSAAGASTSGSANNPNAVAGNPNLVSGPGAGTTGPGIPGLPGIYLDGVQPAQAPQLAQAAQTMSGSERDVAEDTALHAAQTNPALNAPSQDPSVQNFQQTDQDYQQALSANAAASQELQTAQAHVEADKSAIDVARTQLSAITPSVEQQQAFNQMIGAAKTDEDASMLARQNFDSTRVLLSARRDRAAAALADTAPAVDLRGTNSTTVANLKTPAPVSFPAVPARPASTMPKPRSISPAMPTETQLRTRLEGMQQALRRLMEDETKRGEARKEAEADVSEAVEDAEDRGVDMAFDLLLTGWDHCAPALEGGVIGKFERDAKRAEEQIQEVYKQASETKDMSKLGALNQKAEELDGTKNWLEGSINQFERYKLRLDQLHSEKDAAEVIEKSSGDWESSLEGLGKVIQMGLDSKKVVNFLQLSECGVVTVKAGASVIDSMYDIFKEGDAAEEMRRLDDNTTEFLTAQKSIQSQIKRTVAQLNCYKLPDPATVVNCLGAVAH